MLTYIQRANAETKVRMQEIAEAHSHDAEIDEQDNPYIAEYRLEKLRSGYVMATYVKTLHPECIGWYTPGQRMDCASFVRCTLCGDIDIRLDDECPECLNCYGTGRVPEVNYTLRVLTELRANRVNETRWHKAVRTEESTR